MAKTANKSEKILTQITQSVNNGKNYSETFAEVCAKVPCSRRCFDKYWNIAKQQHIESQEAARRRITDIAAQSDIEAAKKGVIERIERLEILTSIARGEPQAQITPGEGPEAQRTKWVFPNQSERQKAIDQLTRMGEGYSPVKKDFQIDSTRDFEIVIE